MSDYRKALTHRAITAALETRTKFDRPLDEPVCVFDMAANLGLRVKFEHLETKNFEGIYSPPIKQVTIEPYRPSLRQRFTCAHEIGHHVFKHGQVPHCTSDGALTQTNTAQEEFLANVFAAFLLMPKAAVLTAFRRRGVKLATAEPLDIYVVACKLGVGFSTLIHHCTRYIPRHLSQRRADLLLKSQRKLNSIRADLLNNLLPEKDLSKLTVYHIAKDWTHPVNMVVGNEPDRGDIVLFDFDLVDPPGALEAIGPRCFRAVKEGTHHLKSTEWEGTLRCYNPTLGGWWKVRIAGDD